MSRNDTSFVSDREARAAYQQLDRTKREVRCVMRSDRVYVVVGTAPSYARNIAGVFTSAISFEDFKEALECAAAPLFEDRAA